jgi:hypothetical protein
MNHPLSIFAIVGLALVAAPATCAGQTRQEQAAAILARVDSPANWTNRHPLLLGPTVIVIPGRPEDGPFGPLKDLAPTSPLSNGAYSFEPSFVFAPFSSRVGGHHAAGSSHGPSRR